MENLTLDLTSFWNQLLASFPIGIVILFFLKRHFSKQDKREEVEALMRRDSKKQLDERLKEIEKALSDIKLSLAGLGVDHVRQMLDDLKKKDYELESKVGALFRIADNEGLSPKRASDK